MAQRMSDAKRSRGFRGVNKASNMQRAMVVSSRYNRRYGARALQRAPGMQRETGFVDLALAGYNMDTTGSIVLIATVPQGAGVSQRVGKKIVWKSLQCRGVVQNNSAAAGTDDAVLIVYDKRPTGALPAITDILTTANSIAFNNDANSGRFTILKRMDFALVGAPSTTTGTESSYVSADFYLPLKNLPCNFKAAATGAIGDIEQGALYLVTVGNQAAGTSAATANLAFRTRFLDI